MNKNIQTTETVDIDRFMGKWYVIANIPTLIEREAYNATEVYARDGERRVQTTFQFRKGGFDGPLKTYKPTGFITGESTSIWKMQFLWPFKSDYRIMFVNDDYSQTVIGRNKRDYVWIMARTPQISDVDFKKLSALIDTQGYDIGELKRVPQRW